MTASLALDIRAASRLAALDPALGQLTAALPQDADAAQWLLHDVVWTPGQACHLAYQVPTGTASPTFVDVSLTPTGWTQHDYTEDSLLPGLAVAADPAAVRARIEALAKFPVQDFRVEPVRYRPGLRGVLRYEVQGGGQRLSYYAKVFRPTDFTNVAPLVAALAGRASGNALVPALAATWPDSQAIVFAGVRGSSVSSVLGDTRLPADQRTRVGHQLGQLLAQFHAQVDVPAPKWTPLDQLARLDQALDAAARCADANLTQRLQAARGILSSTMPAGGAQVVAHGGFRAGQVLLDPDGRLVVLDVDGVCRSDPGRDLGSVLAHLVWQGLCQTRNRAVLDTAAAALLSAYEHAAGPVSRRSLNWWQAAGLLLVAARRFRRLETTDWDRVPTLVDRAEELLGRDQPRPLPLPAVELLDRQRISAVLGRALASTGAHGMLRVESARQLTSASGRRTVVRYRVRGFGTPGTMSIVGKSFAEPRRAELLYENLRLLSGSAPASATGGALRPPSVPQPIAHVPALRLVVYSHCDGVPLSEVTDAGTLLEGMRRAGQWLAGLHSCPVWLPRSLSVDREMASTHMWAAAIGRAYPDFAARARRLADGWASGLPVVPSAPIVPLHKDFHPGHVLVGEELHVIDFDEARQGDRAFDLAHFSVYAQLMEGGEAPGALVAAFLEEYAAASGWPQRGTLSAFRAYAWLKVARQWTVAASPFRDGSPARRRAGVDHALEKGVRCLSE